MTVYIVHHQAAGMVWQFVFANEPTQAQIAVISEQMQRVHGLPGMWTAVRTCTLIEDDSLPEFEVPASKAVVGSGPEPGSNSGVGQADLFTASGSGTITGV